MEQVTGLVGSSPGRFKQALTGLQERFFTVGEFPDLRRDRLPRQVVDRITAVAESELWKLAAELRGRELEGLLLDLQEAVDSQVIDRAARVLDARWSGRLAKLLTVLYLHRYDSPGLNGALRILAGRLRDRGLLDVPENAFICRFGAAEDKFEAVVEAIRESELDIERCFRAAQIRPESPFADRAVLMFLNRTSEEGLAKNRRHIIRAIEQHAPAALCPLINNYLSQFSEKEYDDGISLALLCKMGRDLDSLAWSGIDERWRRRFAQWIYLHELKIHSLPFPKKYAVLSRYRDQIRRSRLFGEENLMVIDFCDLVLADLATDPFSYFYDKEAFDREMTAWQQSKREREHWEAGRRNPPPPTGERVRGALPDASVTPGEAIAEDEEPPLYVPTFLRPGQKKITARDFIIEEREEPCIRLSYEGIDMLYIQEMLDIKMGIEPDMRNKQLKKLKERIR